MRHGGRLQAAIAILNEIEQRELPAASVIREWGRANRYAGSADRAAIGNLVFDALRRRRSAAALLGGDSPRAAVLGAILLEGELDVEALDAILHEDRFAPPPLQQQERDSITAFDPSGIPAAVRTDIPDWCEVHLARAFPTHWEQEASALSARPPLDLRVNARKVSRADLLLSLKAFPAIPTPVSPIGIRIPPASGHRRHPNLEGLPEFAAGKFEIQDEGSQIAALLAAEHQPRRVLDLCAGGGGKTLALSAILAKGAQLFAWDANLARLAPIHARLRRAGCDNVTVLEQKEQLATLAGTMDLVLVDAPCSGSGTWRRRPDTKWRLTEAMLQERMADQKKVLEAAVPFVRPGGRLVYITCSIFPAENEDQIDAFLRAQPGFGIVPPQSLWQSCFPGMDSEACCRPQGIALSPARAGTDGFFISVLVRRPS